MLATKSNVKTRIVYIFSLEDFYFGKKSITKAKLDDESIAGLEEYYDGAIEIYDTKREALEARNYYLRTI